MSARKKAALEVEPLARRLEPMIVDAKMKRFWVLADTHDGTLYADQVSAEYSVSPQGDWEVCVFTNLNTAKRAAAQEKLNNDEDLEPVEVTILRRGSHDR